MNKNYEDKYGNCGTIILELKMDLKFVLLDDNIDYEWKDTYKEWVNEAIKELENMHQNKVVYVKEHTMGGFMIKDITNDLRSVKNDIIERAFDIAEDEERNFADIFIGDDFYDEFDLDFGDERVLDLLIKAIEFDDRVNVVAGMDDFYTLDIILEDKYITWNVGDEE